MNAEQSEDRSKYYKIANTRLGSDGATGALEDPDNIIDRIAAGHTLNEKQKLVFRIAAKAFLEKHDERAMSPAELSSHLLETESNEPLRLLMTGPGGTGKTHAVLALKEFMAHYKSEHRLRLLAPTGSAAVLIGGQTCHKALSLKIRKKQEDEHGILRTHDGERYDVEISVRGRTELRTEWKNVDVVLIDEVSLLSAQILSDIDHALRYAKEKPHIWFGGIIVLFSGDFYQFPPIGGTPLFNSVTYRGEPTHGELRKRLGRLAWKTVNEVIEFTEQYRMKDDPEYGAAVGRLRTRTCTDADVTLFNERIIKSKDAPWGIDMSESSNRDAAMIVNRNYVREKVNLYKAKTNLNTINDKPLVICAARDLVKGKLVPENEHGKFRSRCLAKDTSDRASTGSLPGYIPLYEGMPVILRAKNVSVDLKIANGSQGHVRHIETGIDEYGFTYAKVVLVHFPDSTVQLSGLDVGVYPICPISWAFWVRMKLDEGPPAKYKIQRYQIPIQPAFAITGYSAQGKTIPKVICDLTDGKGGWAAYVSASRARRRSDLYLLKEVRLRDLTKRLPRDLLLEQEKFRAMQHNTMVRYSAKEGHIMKVPDVDDDGVLPAPLAGRRVPEVEWTMPKPRPKPNPNLQKGKGNVKRAPQTDNKASKTGRKRRLREPDMPNKIRRVRLIVPDPPETTGLMGPKWSPQHWSCAYDSAFTVFWILYMGSTATQREEWTTFSPTTNLLGTIYGRLATDLESGRLSCDMMDLGRDKFRQHLYETSPVDFPRWGQNLVTVSEMLYWMIQLPRNTIQLVRDDEIQSGVSLLSPYLGEQRKDDARLRPENRHTLQCWVNRCCTLHDDRVYLEGHSESCDDVSIQRLKSLYAPYWLYFEQSAAASGSIMPSITITIRNLDGESVYDLHAIVYSGNDHFAVRLFVDGKTYIYDGQVAKGRCLVEGRYDALNPTFSELTRWLTLDGKCAHLHVFCQRDVLSS